MTKIEWTDVTWNPVTGCDKVSQGCKNCYAEKMHKRLMGMFPDKYSKSFLHNIQFHQEELERPKQWKKPLKVFVNSMSDLFHEDLDFNYTREIFQVMRTVNRHTYQVLTKRIERVLDFITWWNLNYGHFVWPDNVWIGVSCEDQKTADERIPMLVKVPAAVRFLSCEPLLGAIDLTQIDKFVGGALNALQSHPISSPTKPFIDWVIVGGESGHTARPMHPDWVLSIRNQCSSAGIPFFFKQWGEYMPLEFDTQPPYRFFSSNGRLIDGHGIEVLDPETGGPGKHNGQRFMDPMEAITFCMEQGVDHVDFLHRGKEKFPAMLYGKYHTDFPTISTQIKQ